MDVMSIVIPDTHVWAVVISWIGCYMAGRIIGGGFK